mmetsp:Transcript_33810/g.97163  ORF Transcript_33810/g.97163 Transcript_33810/m.97163 type:complete len:732 (-) Transcript_33810:191-2386(-)
MGQQLSRAGSFVSSPSSVFNGNTSSGPGLSVLHIEVVCARHLGKPSYRVFDSFRRSCHHCAGRRTDINSYVEICFSRGRSWTQTVIADGDGNADFGRASLFFPMDRWHNVSCVTSMHGEHATPELIARVYDRRHLGSLLRGDPLIGEARIQLGFLEFCGRQRNIRLPLKRRGRPRGQLLLSYSVRPATDAYSVLTNTGQHRFVEVADALAQVLSGPDGLKILLETLPQDLAPPGGEKQAQGAVQKLLRSLCNQVGMLVHEGDADVISDSEVLERFARLSHSVQSFVSSCVAPNLDLASPQMDIAGLTEQWIREIFNACVHLSDQLGGVMPKLKDDRLRLFLSAGRQFPGIADLAPIDSKGNVLDAGKAGGSQKSGFSSIPRAALLGDGAQGEVWRAKDRRTGQWYAVKSNLRHHDPADKRERDLVDHILMCPHPCIVQLFGAYYFDQRPHSSVIMEFCEGGDLHTRIDRIASRSGEDDYQPPPEAMQWIGQIFLALEHLHLKLQTLLRDLKPQNVVLTHGRAKLTDFGHGRIGAHAPGVFTLHCGPPGSPHFVAPEVVRKRPYDWKVDLYSLGVLIWVVLTGGLLETPALPPCNHMSNDHDFEALSANCKLLEQCIRDPLCAGAREMPSADSASFVQALIQENPARRPSHEKIRTHPFMKRLRLPPASARSDVIEGWLAGKIPNTWSMQTSETCTPNETAQGGESYISDDFHIERSEQRASLLSGRRSSAS